MCDWNSFKPPATSPSPIFFSTLSPTIAHLTSDSGWSAALPRRLPPPQEGQNTLEFIKKEVHIERSRSEAAAEAAPASSNRRGPRARRTRRAAAEEEPAPAVEVDARADDFIRRFREQLRLQRLDSILRCRDTLRRTGTA